LVGKWLRSASHRERIFLLSKGGHPLPIVAPNRLRDKDLRADLFGSLRRLGTDYLDLFLLHRDHEQVDLEALADLLCGFQTAGHVRGFGVSNWTHERVASLQKVTVEKHGIRLAASSPQFSLASWTSPLWPGCVSISGAEGEA